jgi:tetratricopeptide (TPR) repeat protein
MGQVRIEQGDHDQALVAFDQAHARASELVARAPRDAGRRFLLAQVQAHIGGVAWAQGRYDDAGGWLRAYRDSALQLVALEPGNFDYQREVADGHHNLAVLDQSLGRDAEAERAFLAELALYRQWMREHPADAGLRSRAANVASFLGSLAARQGRLREAVRFFDEDVRAIRRNLRAEPTDAASQAELVEELVFLAQTQVTLGQLQDARANLLEANALADRLSRQDPDNAGWRNAVGYSRWWRSEVEAGTDPDAAMTDALAAEAVFARSHAAAPKDQNNLSWLAKSRLQLAQLALRSGQIAHARDWLARARALFAIPPSGDALHGMQAEIALLEGDLRAQEGDHEAARRAWREAERLLLAGLDGPVPFERLEALARAQLALGKRSSAMAHLQRLDAAGVPLSPRPQVAAAPAERSARSR